MCVYALEVTGEGKCLCVRAQVLVCVCARVYPFLDELVWFVESAIPKPKPEDELV